MKKNDFSKRIMAAAAMLLMMSAQSFADDFNCVWVKAKTYPANSGKVYVTYNLNDYEETMLADSSEFKRSSNMTTSDAFIMTEPASGWLFAGVVRDMNMNGVYDADTDRQIHVFWSHYFTCFYDHTNFHGQSSTEAQELADEALAEMKKPTDQVIAVFTKGAVASRAEDEEAFGYVFSSKLDNKPGDQVTFYAYGDYDSRKSPNVYYKFDSWLDAVGNKVSTDREFTITVKGMEQYYAHFVKTTKSEWDQTEKVLFPERYKWDYNNDDWNPSEWNGIEEIKAALGTRGNKVYDLQGRRIQKAAKGMYIVGGKKVIVK
jgi:hypothetical protein